MTCEQSAITEVVIQIFIAVDIANATSFTVAHEQRVWRIVAVVAANANGDALAYALMRLA